MKTELKMVKFDNELGLVFGFAIVCLEDDKPYYDLQDEHIPENVMLKSATDFMENSRIAKEMHSGHDVGTVVFAFPLTTEIANAMGILTSKTGLMVAMRPNKDVLHKFKNKELTGFSIGGLKEVELEKNN